MHCWKYGWVEEINSSKCRKILIASTVNREEIAQRGFSKGTREIEEIWGEWKHSYLEHC